MSTSDAIARLQQFVWRRAPLPTFVRDRLRGKAAGAVSKVSERQISQAKDRRPREGGLVVTGYHIGQSGLARAVGLTCNALESSGFPLIRHDIEGDLSSSAMLSCDLPGSPGGVWILQCNGAETAQVLTRLRVESWSERYRIAYWVWETSLAPSDWSRVASAFHEIWTPSAYSAQALSRFNVPVRVMPHPVKLSDTTHEPATPPVVMVLADFRSGAQRKNLVGALEVWRAALRTSKTRGARLIVKIMHSDADLSARHALEARLADLEGVVLIDKQLTSENMEALLDSVDILLSLHRSEGFGLTLAEMLARGACVLATGQSGNMTFMQGLDDLLVDATLTPVMDPNGPYRANKGACWFEPDLRDATHKLSRLLDDVEARRVLGAAGRERVRTLSNFWKPSAPNIAQLERWVRKQ